jgi:hypothetical protein
MLKDFYTPLAEAVDELHTRRNSLKLCALAHAQIKLTEGISPLLQMPHLVMFRQVLTPLHEILLFLRLAKKYNLTPFIIEYYDDIFVFTGIQNIEAFEYKTILDFNSFTGKKLSEVTTKKGESLIELHHHLFYDVTKIEAHTIATDCSSWFKQYGTSAQYYNDFLKLFVCNNILFETFLTEGEERKLTYEVVLPAYQSCMAQIGEKPLIVHATYEDTSEDPAILNHYPKSITEILSQKGYS